MKIKKALVTGGAGFIGSHLCEALLQKNYQVICLDNFSVGLKDNLKDFSQNKKFKVVTGDVRDKDLVQNLVKKVDIIYHLAAVVGVSVVVENPLENISVNIDGTKTIVESAYKLGKKKVVFTSSSEVYGKNDKVPLKEDSSDSVFGLTKVTRWAYGLAKALDEHLLLGYAEKGLPVAIVRYFNCYGPRGMNHAYANVIPKFISQAIANQPITVHSDGKASRSFCYVSDTVNGTILAGEKVNNEILNIGSAEKIRIVDLAKKIKKLTNSKSKIVFIPEKKVYKRKFEGSKHRVPSLGKAARLIRFRAKVNLDQGLTKTIDWTRSQKKNLKAST